MGATFVVKPFSGKDLLAVLFRTMSHPPGVSAPIRRHLNDVVWRDALQEFRFQWISAAAIVDTAP